MEEEDGTDMIKVISTNITSPLGLTTEENYQALKAGHSLLKRHDLWHGIPAPFTASLFSEEQVEKLSIEGFSRFESLVLHSVQEALEHADVDLGSQRTLFILSTTKANVEELAESPEKDREYLAPGTAAKKIANHLGIVSEPITVCNACISGVTAQHLAHRLIIAGAYDTAIVCGADCQSPFVVGGFMSFKSLSPEECRPFDIERLGLNLGEAASTIIYSKAKDEDAGKDEWILYNGHLDNDAYHVSAPSPVGEGTCKVIVNTMNGWDAEDLALINVHGTATMFNDQMESKAIERTSLSSVPLLALKGYYGHTLGASGVLEAAVTMRSLDEGIILPTRGFSEIGVSGKVSISDRSQATEKRSFMKIISGFGGCNGALIFSKDKHEDVMDMPVESEVLHTLHLTSDSLQIDGEMIETDSNGKALLTELYKRFVGDYAKFYKMDVFSRLAFLASELILQKEDEEARKEEHSIILFNSSSSIVADRNHISTICDTDSFYPSPSVFLYTLPNVVTGEIAIKNSFTGETSLYILDDKNEALIDQITKASITSSGSRRIISGWVDCPDEDRFEADLRILTIKE